MMMMMMIDHHHNHHHHHRRHHNGMNTHNEDNTGDAASILARYEMFL